MADPTIPAVSTPASTPAVAIPAPAPQPVQATPTTATPTLTDTNLHAAAQGLSTVVGGGQPVSPKPVEPGLSLMPYVGKYAFERGGYCAPSCLIKEPAIR